MESEPEYVTVNRQAYDRLAFEYRERAAVDRIRDLSIVAPMATYLKGQFPAGARVLDVGCGNGINLAMFHELGFRVSGIDISGKMLDVAREFCPTADFRFGDFLHSTYSPASFEGVFSKASIHLFPKRDAALALERMADVLVIDGMLYVTTTVSETSSEGYSRKEDYGQRLVRFRKTWTPPELVESVVGAGFTIYNTSYNSEKERGKTWFNIWATKKMR